MATEEAIIRMTTLPGPRLNVAKLKEDSLARTINRANDTTLGNAGPAGTVVNVTVSFIRRICDSVMPRKRNIQGRKMFVY